MNLFRISTGLVVLLLISPLFSVKALAADDPMATLQNGTPEQKQQVVATWIKDVKDNPAQYQGLVWQQWAAALIKANMEKECLQLLDATLDTIKNSPDLTEDQKTCYVNVSAYQVFAPIRLGHLGDAMNVLYGMKGKMIGDRVVASNRGVYLELSDALLKAKQPKDAADVIEMGIMMEPKDSWLMEQLVPMRTQAFLAAKNYESALEAEKGVYNFVPLSDTAKVVNQLAIYLIAAKPKEHGLAGRLRAQQFAGMTAGASTTQPAQADDNILKTIPVDGKQFDDGIKLLDPSKFDDLIAKGNLLLLADRGTEARAAFEAAEKLVKEQGQMDLVVGGIARSIRAEDGTVGRANAYIMSLREAK